MLRLFWKALYPLCIIGNSWFGVSYKWVNVSRAAWRQDLFDPLWHWKWFGDEPSSLPDKVNLCGITYRTIVSEGMVQFIPADGMSGGRMIFERDPHGKYDFLWYIEAGRFAAPHMAMAYKWIQAVYGGSHDLKRPALK